MSRKSLIFVILFLLLFILPGSVSILTDWLWFQSIGFENVFTTVLTEKLFLGIVVGIATFFIIYFNLRTASRLTQGRPVMIYLEPGKNPVEVGRHIDKLALWMCIVIGLLTGAAASDSWSIVLKYLNAASFGITDPIFNRDISFYFFTLPFIKTSLGFIFQIVVLSLVGAFTIYYSRGALSSIFRKFNISRQIPEIVLLDKKTESRTRSHLFILLFIFFIVLALKTYYIRIPELLYSTTGPFTGAGYTDLNVTLPILKLTVLLLILLAIASLINIFREKIKLMITLAGVYLVIAFVAVWALPSIIQSYIVEPNELVKETPYIKHNISYTQKAFKLDGISQYNLEGKKSLTMADIKENYNTIKNIRLWDQDPLLDTFGQLQEIRTYYDFVSIDNDRYNIGGEYRQTLLSPRELNSRLLPQKNFINQRLTFTHGYGLTLSPVNEVTGEGLPVLFIKDLPPVTTEKSLNISRPEIYYGELTNGYVVVNTKAKEFDYPSGEKNVFKVYDGKGGVAINSIFRKLLMALNFRDSKLLLSEDITPKSRIMYYRSVQGRVKRVFPFLKLDNDPYMVIDKDGTLKWIQDAYTVSDRYPYSQRVKNGRKNINYIRNSVKVVISAYDGQMQFYVADPDDPVIRTYEKIFKGAFLPLSEMPAYLKQHLRYPEDIFIFQTALYTVYHMEEPQIFYNKEDMWQIPVISEGKRDPMVRHIIMKLPNEVKEEYILMIPFTPKGKDNMAAWMVARADGENYGKLAVYRFPKQKLVYGPKQIINRINQDPEISRQISLWDQRGSEVNQGSLLVIPIKESLLYVRALYLRSEGGKIPELRRVIVAYENRIVMRETLDEAIEAIFGTTGGTMESKSTEIPEKTKETFMLPEEIISQARQHYDAAIQAQKQGNWAKYGEEIKMLGDILEKIKESSKTPAK